MSVFSLIFMLLQAVTHLKLSVKHDISKNLISSNLEKNTLSPTKSYLTIKMYAKDDFHQKQMFVKENSFSGKCYLKTELTANKELKL
jgi:hypothetical protein